MGERAIEAVRLSARILNNPFPMPMAQLRSPCRQRLSPRSITGWVRLVLVSCLLPIAGADDLDSYRQAIAEWRAAREARLRDPYGWLSLVGLHWLKEGENRFGSGESNRVVLPGRKAPEHAGAFRVAHGEVTLTVAPGVTVTHDTEAVRSMVLRDDSDGKPTVLQHGSLRFHVIRRGERLGVRVKDADSSVLREFKGMDYYSVEPQWRFEARFEPYEPPKALKIPNIIGTVETQPSPGAVVFEVDGAVHRLDAVAGDGSLFLVFGDETNGSETYGGGRFVYTDLPSKDGRLVLDFNKVYNPPCVFTPYATCPLPPRQNRLSLAVRAGEKAYGGLEH